MCDFDESFKKLSKNLVFECVLEEKCKVFCFPIPLGAQAGGVLNWHGICICACLLGHFFAKFGIVIGGFSSETKEPKLHKLGVFWANYCKKHPIWSKLSALLSKMVYWWVGNLAKNWYRDSQIFEVRQAHPRTILVKEPPRRTGLCCIHESIIHITCMWLVHVLIVYNISLMQVFVSIH